MIEQRKASDILLDLETEVKLMKAIINIQDSLLKTLLNNVNKINNTLDLLIESQSLTPEQNELMRQKNQSAISQTITIPSGIPINVETEFKGQRRIGPSTKASNADIEFKDYMAQRRVAAEEQKEIKPKAEDLKQERKIPITQRVQDNNGKDVFMARVSIHSLSGSLVLNTKTNAMGKWQAQIPPGKYSVKISKMDSSTQKSLESQQEISVPNSNNAITLSTLIINRI